MANLYLDESLAAAGLRQGSLVEVTGEEARHAVRVSRLRVGERIAVGDGRGTIAEGEVESAQKDRFTVRVDTVTGVPAPDHRLVLVQALAKGDRDERAVEQATEFGVDAIAPWQAERSVSRWSGAEKIDRGMEKWRRIAREASKQSLRAWMPEVIAPLATSGLAELAGRDGVAVVVLHPRGEGSLSDWAAERASRDSWPAETFLVVGPEGGISDAELDELEHAGALIARLGNTVLRTSSAGPAALAVLNVALGRW